MINHKDLKTSYQNLFETLNELTIHQRNRQVLMTKSYKIVNSATPPVMNIYMTLNCQVLLRRTVNYEIDTVTYRAPFLCSKLPSEYKLSASIKEFKVRIKK